MSSHHFLLGIKQETILGAENLRKTLNILSQHFDFERTSSYYKRYFTLKNEDLNSEIMVVVKGACHKNHLELKLALDEILEKLTKTQFLLLTFDQLVMLSPELPLPNPELAMDPGILRCAAEVWGDYEHPILGQSLNEVVKAVHSFEHIEFFAQGETLL